MCKSVNIFVFRSYQCCPGALNTMLQEHSLFCQCFKIVNIGNFAVESESQTSSPSHESESEGSRGSPSPSYCT